MILPKTDISMMMVRNVLRVPSLDQGTLCGSHKINMWAKYKPVRNAFTFDRPIYWWKAFDGKCGINYQTFTSIGNMFNIIDAGGVTYDYQPPRGGASEPFRRGDFAGYNSDAIPPITPGILSPEHYRAVGIQAFCNIPQVPENNLTLADLFDSTIMNFYYGIGLKKQGTAEYLYMTENDPLNVNGGGGITFPATALSLGVYEIVQFLAEKKRTDPYGTDVPNMFVLIPSSIGYKQTVQLLDAPVYVILIIDLSGTNTLTIRYTVVNQSSQTVNITSPSVFLRYADNDITKPTEQGEGTVSVPTLSVPAGTTRTSTNYVTSSYLPNILSRGGGYGYFTSNGGTYKATVPINEPY